MIFQFLILFILMVNVLLRIIQGMNMKISLQNENSNGNGKIN